MTFRTAVATCLAVATFLTAGPALADDWDLSSDDDNDAQTDNELFHGSEQVHDLGVPSQSALADQDWYLVGSQAFSSYQVVVDGMSGDLDLTTTSLQRIDASAVQTLQSALVGDFGGILSLEWQQGATAAGHYARVRGAACGLTCGAQQTYRIRFYDSTYTVPRFNNTATQATVLLVQNATDRSCDVAYHFLRADGQLITSVASVLTPRELEVVPAAGPAPGQSGSVRVTHTCGYGGLSGKAVSVEPATGFTFDTALRARPY